MIMKHIIMIIRIALLSQHRYKIYASPKVDVFMVITYFGVRSTAPNLLKV